MIHSRLARLPRLPHLIRFRLTLWYTSLVALVLAAFVGGVFYEFKQYQFDRYDDQFKAVLQDTFNREVKLNFNPACYAPYTRGLGHVSDLTTCGLQVQNPSALNQNGLHIQFTSENGKPLPTRYGTSSAPPPNSPLKQRSATKDQATVQDEAKRGASTQPIVNNCGQYRCLAMTLHSEYGPVVGQIAAPLTHIADQVDRLKDILVYIAGTLLLISAAGGWILAGRALKPIDDITRRARQITANDLGQRLNLDQEDELGRMAATFDDMIARLQEAFERQKRFASDASHELRTPLTVMQAELGLALARPRSAAEYRQTLLSMDEEVGRLSTIVSDLLTLTRIDVDPAGMQHKPVELAEMLDSLSARVSIIAAERNVTVEAERLRPVTIVGDATRLRQLFTNLLDNAVNYTPDGGRVTVTLEETRDGVHVGVSDTGIGIAPEHMARIFERFYRADGAREQNAHGTGLGLAISRSVVQAHHGDILVESEPGQGTTFTVTLPSDSRKAARRAQPWRALVPKLVASGQ